MAPKSFAGLFGQHFSRFTDDDWLAFSRRSFKLARKRLVPTYDAAVAKTLDGIDFDPPAAAAVAEFERSAACR